MKKENKNVLLKFDEIINNIPTDIKNDLNNQKNKNLAEISSYYFNLKSKLVRPRFIILLSLLVSEMKNKKTKKQNEIPKIKNKKEISETKNEIVISENKNLEYILNSKELEKSKSWSSIIEMVHTASLYHVI